MDFMWDNLISNPNFIVNSWVDGAVTDLDFSDWTVDQGGDGWRCERIPTGSSVSSCPKEDSELGSCAVGSFRWCTRNQYIDLTQKGYSPTLLDFERPPILFYEWVLSNEDCAGTYYISVRLLDEDKKEIDGCSFNTGKCVAPSRQWEKIQHQFTDYPLGVRYVYFEDGSKDTTFWKGYYGAKLSFPTVKVMLGLYGGKEDNSKGSGVGDDFYFLKDEGKGEDEESMKKDNLINNPNFIFNSWVDDFETDLDFSDWTIKASGGDGWKCERKPLGSSISSFPKEDNGQGTCAVGSFQWCRRNQYIDLTQKGYSRTLLDSERPPILFYEWVLSREDCPGSYYIFVCLLNEDKEKINGSSFYTGECIAPSREWKKIQYRFTYYPSGVRYVYFEDGSKDTRFWRGHYGAKLSFPTVKVLSGDHREKDNNESIRCVTENDDHGKEEEKQGEEVGEDEDEENSEDKETYEDVGKSKDEEEDEDEEEYEYEGTSEEEETYEDIRKGEDEGEYEEEESTDEEFESENYYYSDSDDEAEAMPEKNFTGFPWRDYTSRSRWYQQLIDGDVHIQIPSQARIVRIFTSSTFTDTEVERNTLMKNVYPKLKAYCQQIQYEFQVVDMRWGVRNEATADHMNAFLCMRELEACKRLSTGPNFITFLGQKYGYRPFPPIIEAIEFEQMKSTVEDKSHLEVLEKWFIKDSNFVPPVYALQPIHTYLPDYSDRTKEQWNTASESWKADFNLMQAVLRKAASQALSNQKDIDKYHISVTEDEITRGILNAEDVKDHCFWFQRNIIDLEDNVEDVNAKKFIDKINESLDQAAVTNVKKLREQKVLQALPEDNVIKYDIHWHKNKGISPEDNTEHSDYINQLCADFESILVRMINTAVEAEERKEEEMADTLGDEISAHMLMCQDKLKTFCGRQKILSEIMEYVNGSGDAPLVVFGKSGCGKTAIMASAAKKIKTAIPEVKLVLRFLGTTQESSTVNILLQSICSQLLTIKEDSTTQIPQDFNSVKDFFVATLKDLPGKVVLLLDSLDQLSKEDGAHFMTWLPKTLPENVKVIVSTLPDPKIGILQTLQEKLPQGSFLEVPALPSATAKEILSSWLTDAKRDLTEYQKETIINAFQDCSLPLYLKLCFEESFQWKSYSPLEATVLSKDVGTSITRLFERLETLHGEIFVSHVLGYITASKYGLSDAEIDDIVSLDDLVLNDVYQYWTPPVRRIPPMLWLRLKNDLGPFIVERGADGMTVNTWFHRQFYETAERRYLSEEQRKNLHSMVADYYLGTWGNKKKKEFKNKRGKWEAEERLVPSMENILSVDKDGPSVIFNIRKLNELPWHLSKSHDLNKLKKEALLNFDFLLSKLRGVGLSEILQDFKLAVDLYPGDFETKLLYDFFRRSSVTLLNSSYQLAAQLIGRLKEYSDHSGILQLLQEASKADIPCLLPHIGCLEKPVDSLTYTLVGHTKCVTCISLSKDERRLVSVSDGDNFLRVWDLVTGTMSGVIEVPHDDHSRCGYVQVVLFNNAKCAVMHKGEVVAVDVEAENVIFRSNENANQVLIASDDKHMVVFGLLKVDVYDMQGNTLTTSATWELEDGVVLLATASQDLLAYSYRKNKNNDEIIVKSLGNGPKRVVKSPHSFRQFIFTPSGDELIALAAEFQGTYKMIIWETGTWSITKILRSNFCHGYWRIIDDICVADWDGNVIIWPSYDEGQLNFWNVSTGSLKHAVKPRFRADVRCTQALTNGKRTLVSFSSQNAEYSIQVSDLHKLEFTEDLARLKSEGYDPGDDPVSYRNFPHPEDENAILSYGASAVAKLWDIKNQQCVKTIDLYNKLIKLNIYPVGEDYLAVWDRTRPIVHLINLPASSLIQTTNWGKFRESIRDTSFLGMWSYLGDFLFLRLSESRDSLVIWDLKQGCKCQSIVFGRNRLGHTIHVTRDKSRVICTMTTKNNVEKFAFYDLKNTSTAPVYVSNKVYKNRFHTEGDPFETHYCALTEDGSLFAYIASYAFRQIGFPVDLLIVITERMYWFMDRAGEGPAIAINISKADNITIVNTETSGDRYRISIHKVKKYAMNIPSVEEVRGWKRGTRIKAVAISHQAKYVAIHCSYRRRDAGNVFAVYSLLDHQLIYMEKFQDFDLLQISKDGSRLLTYVSRGSEAFGGIQRHVSLWDMTEVHSGKVTLIGQFMPEMDMKSCHLAEHDDTICIAMCGTEDMVFLRRCGSKQEDKISKDCPNFRLHGILPEEE